jgi:phenylacetate-coenzyme A ligase PaaK-like adenylate-forming protein
MWDPQAERMSADERAALQARRLDDLVGRLAERSPLYRERLAAAGVGAGTRVGLDGLVDLPFTTKQDLWDGYPWGLLSIPREQVLRVHGSSGTGGRPTLVAYSRADLAIWAEVCARALGCAGAGPGTLVHNAYGYGLFTGGLGMHAGAELMGCTLVPVSGGQTQRQVTLLRDLRPEVLCCTPSYAARLGEALGEAGVARDQVALRVGIFGAEPWSEAMRAQIEALLPLKALDIYGLSEVIGPGVACECVQAQAGLHVNEDHFLVEVVDPASGRPSAAGERGELVFTTLTKEAMPLLRYRTGDIAALDRSACACGRTLARMSKVSGRHDDMLVIRGVNVYPERGRGGAGRRAGRRPPLPAGGRPHRDHAKAGGGLRAGRRLDDLRRDRGGRARPGRRRGRRRPAGAARPGHRGPGPARRGHPTGGAGQGPTGRGAHPGP